MTENEAIEVFNEILSVPDEILLKYKNALNEDKENALIKLKCAQILAVRCLKEIQMYRDGKLSLVPSDVFKRKCEELDDYKEIGTVEECRKAVEKHRAKKPLAGVDNYGNEYSICRECSAVVEIKENRCDYCPDCGQAIQWDENLEGMEDE